MIDPPASAPPTPIDEILPDILAAAQLHLEGYPEAALHRLDAILHDKPWCLPIQIDRGLILAELGRYSEALEAFDHFLQYAPPSPDIEAIRQAMLQDAFAALDQAGQASPENTAARQASIELHLKCGQYEAAITACRELLAQHPRQADALNSLGHALLALNRHDEALAAYAEALGSDAGRAEIWHNRGNVLQQLGQLTAARDMYREALRIHPDFAQAGLETGFTYLLAGDPAGWPWLEWRWQTPQLRPARLATSRPLWLGGIEHPNLPQKTVWPIAMDPSLAGKTLLVWAEQGAGDTLQFARFLNDLPAQASRVIFRVPQALLSLLQHNLAPHIEVISDAAPLPPHDLHCPIMSLPLALNQPGPNPTAPPYLRADPALSLAWQQRLGASALPRVGLVWAGRQFGQRNLTRDLPLSALQALSELPVELISLQKEIPAADQDFLNKVPMRQFSAWLSDFSQTAGLIDHLDLVISADTAVAHLAGALGKPCWLMLRFGSEWRWQHGREDSPWYPSLRIFRQRTAGDWSSVLKPLTAALNNLRQE